MQSCRYILCLIGSLAAIGKSFVSDRVLSQRKGPCYRFNGLPLTERRSDTITSPNDSDDARRDALPGAHGPRDDALKLVIRTGLEGSVNSRFGI